MASYGVLSPETCLLALPFVFKIQMGQKIYSEKS